MILDNLWMVNLVSYSLKLLFSSVQSLSCVWLFSTPGTAAHQASLSITNSWSLLKPTSIESVTPSNYLILCRPHLLLSSIFPSIRVFSNESVLRIRWPKYAFGISQLKTQKSSVYTLIFHQSPWFADLSQVRILYREIVISKRKGNFAG